MNEIQDIECWCGFPSRFHHISSSIRKDNKQTVWFKCVNGHRVYIDFQSAGELFIPKEKKGKGKKIKNETKEESKETIDSDGTL